MNPKTQRFILSSLHPLHYPLVFRYYVHDIENAKQTRERERETERFEEKRELIRAAAQWRRLLAKEWRRKPMKIAALRGS